MKLWFVISGTADNYIMAETSNGILASSCPYDGRFAGVDLSSYNDDDEKIPGEVIADLIAKSVDPDLDETDLDWMGDPCFESYSDWEAFQKAQEPFNRDEAFPIN